MRIHLDTDIGSDTDDASALAMLLGWPGVELVGITTVIDPGGRRAGFVERCLELAGLADVPVASSEEVSMTTHEIAGTIPDDERYWGGQIEPRPSRPGDAVSLLRANVEAGATVVAIGPYTNLAAMEATHPGALGRTPVVLMGGFVTPADPGLPEWGPEMDWNVQCDTLAAQMVFTHATDVTLVTVGPTFKAHLRSAHLPRLRAAGALGTLLARQAEAHCADNAVADLARAHAALPDDLLNFQYDAVACAVAAGWDGARAQSMRLATVLEAGVLRFTPDDRGRAADRRRRHRCRRLHRALVHGRRECLVTSLTA